MNCGCIAYSYPIAFRSLETCSVALCYLYIPNLYLYLQPKPELLALHDDRLIYRVHATTMRHFQEGERSNGHLNSEPASPPPFTRYYMFALAAASSLHPVHTNIILLREPVTVKIIFYYY